MFYTFSQNNSGGGYVYCGKSGITVHVIIEADNVKQAIRKAEDIGIYFDGVDKGFDCDCCGDRWYEPHADDGSEFPEVFGKDVRNRDANIIKWIKEASVAIHYKDGKLAWHH